MNDFQTPLWVCAYMASLLPDNVVRVLEPTPGQGNLVNALEGFDVTAPVDFYKIHGFYDAVVMNPPFTPMKKGYEILLKCMGMTDIVIALMPWLSLINSEKRTNIIMEYGLKSVTHLPRHVFNGARVQCCILELKSGYVGKTEFKTINNRRL